MSEKPRALGDKLGIFFNLHDELDSFPKRVFVELSDLQGNVLEPIFEIPHIRGGLFQDTSSPAREMPNTEQVIARYFVRDPLANLVANTSAEFSDLPISCTHGSSSMVFKLINENVSTDLLSKLCQVQDAVNILLAGGLVTQLEGQIIEDEVLTGMVDAEEIELIGTIEC